MLVSQKISDFDPAMRSAMNISILFRTKYEGDLKRGSQDAWKREIRDNSEATYRPLSFSSSRHLRAVCYCMETNVFATLRTLKIEKQSHYLNHTVV